MGVRPELRPSSCPPWGPSHSWDHSSAIYWELPISGATRRVEATSLGSPLHGPASFQHPSLHRNPRSRADQPRRASMTRLGTVNSPSPPGRTSLAERKSPQQTTHAQTGEASPHLKINTRPSFRNPHPMDAPPTPASRLGSTPPAPCPPTLAPAPGPAQRLPTACLPGCSRQQGRGALIQKGHCR